MIRIFRSFFPLEWIRIGRVWRRKNWLKLTGRVLIFNASTEYVANRNVVKVVPSFSERGVLA